jgi:ABC-2 type transport system ATP-binding protein
VDAAALGAAGFTRGSADGVYYVEAEDPAALNAAVDRARAAGALLVELRRDGADLESVLLGTVAPAGAVGVAA